MPHSNGNTLPSLSLLSAGSNAQGQLATGSSDDAHTFTTCIFADCPPGTLPPDTISIAQIACGANHTLTLLQRTVGAELWGCGDGRRGQLGPSYLADVAGGSTSVFRRLDLQSELRVVGMAGYTPRMIAVGWETSYVVLSSAGKSDMLISMGADDFGNLGVGGAKGKGVAGRPFHVVELRSLFAQEYTDVADENRHLSVLSLATGPHHVVVQLELTLLDGSTRLLVAGWGKARHGQLGDAGSTSQKLSSSYAAPRTVRLDYDTHDSIKSLALGNQHTVFLHQSGRVSGVGIDRKGQLRNLDSLTDVQEVACTWNSTFAVVRDDDGQRVISTGSHTKGQLGRGLVDLDGLGPVCFPFSNDTHRLAKIACGSEHILCLFTLVDSSRGTALQTEVWGWGWNEHGNLGVGSLDDQVLPIRIWPPDESSGPVGRALDIYCGNGTSWVVIVQ